MDLASLLTTILAVTTVVAAALAGLSLGLIRTLRDSNEALRHRVDEQEAEIKVLKADRDALARVVTGETHWASLSDQLDEHHSESMRAWTGILDAIVKMGGARRDPRA